MSMVYPYKSKKCELWPILYYFPELPQCGVRVIGMYLVESKPNDYLEFLRRFVDEAKVLESVGMVYHGQVVIIKIEAIICNAVARACITETKSHSGYYGCPKCETRGVYVMNPHSRRRGRVTFQNTFARKKTDTSFRQRRQRLNHKYRSILKELNIDMVKNIPNDTMHLFYLVV